ncbi:MAG TPA: SOS response-associated peptidase [Thermoanaerobaculia bacterium]|jgi:putative SOS response-associated peptidase YedK|nr:SOS response-associated peptidase [Thermoanaerobaculia bacterium]
MCGRYSLSSTAELVRETFDVEESAELEPRWNVAPTQEAPVVRRTPAATRRLSLLRWGLIARGATSVAGGQINARSETVETLPAFRDAFRERRCLVPADGFYEWLKLEGQRHPFHIRRRDRRPFAFAGLWSRWQPKHELPIDSFTILTCPPSELVRPLHDRMPVILPPAAWEPWLSPDTAADELRALFVPWAGDELEAVPVSSAVNRADHEGADCWREVPRPVAKQLSLLPS